MPDATIQILLDEPIGTISPLLHGHFMEHLGGCIDGGIWVGPDSPIPNTGGLRNDVVRALKAIEAPVLRWPGGCFADDYHWRDGIGPRSSRPRRVNMHWGNCIEHNGFGTHEFMDLCRAVEAKPYFAGNLGSGSPKEMRDWVEYCNFPGGSTLSDERIENGAKEPFGIQYWGVGNENWGCGGSFTPEDYATEYRRFSTFLRDWGGTKLRLVACGPNQNDEEWTRRFFEKLKRSFWDIASIHGYSAHLYSYSDSTAIEFEESHWYQLLVSGFAVENMIVRQRALMDEYDPERKIGLIVDEWGAWHKSTPGAAALWQQSTVRDAVLASMSFDIFHKHAEKLEMCNIAQTINVLQSLILTEDEHMTLTPTYHVFDLYRAHQGGQSLKLGIEAKIVAEGIAQISASASIKDNVLTLTVTNLSMTEGASVGVKLPSANPVSARGLCYDGDVHAHNTKDNPDAVGLNYMAMPIVSDGGFVIEMDPASIIRVTVQL